MNDKFFIDTNIFVYSLDKRQPDKQKRALELIASALETGTGTTSYQVIQEFLNVATCKFSEAMTVPDAKKFLQKILYPLCSVFPDLALYDSALNLAKRTEYSFYDSLILAAALKSDCTLLCSGDLQPNYPLDGLRIVNPFN